MSYARFIELFCDGPGEEGRGCTCVLAHVQSTVADARREARKEGWTHRNGRDLCADCTARGKENAT